MIDNELIEVARQCYYDCSDDCPFHHYGNMCMEELTRALADRLQAKLINENAHK